MEPEEETHPRMRPRRRPPPKGTQLRIWRDVGIEGRRGGKKKEKDIELLDTRVFRERSRMRPAKRKKRVVDPEEGGLFTEERGLAPLEEEDVILRAVDEELWTPDIEEEDSETRSPEEVVPLPRVTAETVDEEILRIIRRAEAKQHRRLREFQEAGYTVYKEKQVPALTERQKELIRWAKIKIPTKKQKLVAVRKPKRVRDVEITHESLFKGEIGPLGIVLPVRRGRKTQTVHQTLLPRRRPSLFSPRRQPVKSPSQFTTKKLTVYDFYNRPITQEMREAVVETLFDLISTKRIPVSTLENEPKLAEPLIPGLLGSQDSKPKVMVGTTRISKKDFINRELRLILHKEIYSSLLQDARNEENKEKAHQQYRDMTDLEKILDSLQARLGVDIFEINGEQIFERLNLLKELTVLEIYIKAFLSGKGSEGQKRLSGKFLRLTLARLISEYKKKFVPSEEQIYRKIVQNEASKRFEEIFRRDRKVLEDEYGESLEKRYKQEIQSKTSKEKKSPKETHRLTERGKDIYRQIQEMEEQMLLKLGSPSPTIFEYLQTVLVPALFLDQIGDIGRHAKFFQAKIKTGAIQIRALARANLAHYIPELLMKYVGKDSESLQIAIERLGSDLQRRIDEFIALFMIGKGFRVSLPPQLSFFPWKRFLSSPQDVCFQDTKTGYTRKKTRVGWERVAIPDQDLVICYIPGMGFACHSVHQVILDIIQEKDSSVTGKPYPQDFIRKIEERYPLLLSQAVLKLVEEDASEEFIQKIEKKYPEILPMIVHLVVREGHKKYPQWFLKRLEKRKEFQKELQEFEEELFGST